MYVCVCVCMCVCVCGICMCGVCIVFVCGVCGVCVCVYMYTCGVCACAWTAQNYKLFFFLFVYSSKRNSTKQSYTIPTDGGIVIQLRWLSRGELFYI